MIISYSGWYLGSLLFGGADGQAASPGQTAVGVMYILVGFMWLAGAFPAVALLILVSQLH